MHQAEGRNIRTCHLTLWYRSEWQLVATAQPGTGQCLDVWLLWYFQLPYTQRKQPRSVHPYCMARYWNSEGLTTQLAYMWAYMAEQ